MGLKINIYCLNFWPLIYSDGIFLIGNFVILALDVLVGIINLSIELLSLLILQIPKRTSHTQIPFKFL